MPYRIEYDQDARNHVRSLTARDRATVLDQVDKQLTQQPTARTRNRKRLRKNPLALWELRVGDLRVFYDVVEEPEPTVFIRAVGTKVGSRLRVGNEWRTL